MTYYARCVCPYCGALIDAHTFIWGNESKETLPKPGDWALCDKCGEICRFFYGPVGFGLRALTQEDHDKIKNDSPEQFREELQRARDLIGMAHRLYRTRKEKPN